ncbi:MAG: helix-turn-helix transcriptional regulator [Acidobacteria bacterium]|nr:helix-turn-helix transcriptional regulator [Acidobacteriota bacterium]MBI3425299.1 helix-turn-helix transcriptional regulator [Acidobacteriota bacterium]
MDVTQVFADNIKRLRLAQGLSQEALADLAGLHRTYIGAVERGERNITLLNANRIAAALGVKLSDCLKERNERKRKN